MAVDWQADQGGKSIEEEVSDINKRTHSKFNRIIATVDCDAELASHSWVPHLQF